MTRSATSVGVVAELARRELLKLSAASAASALLVNACTAAAEGAPGPSTFGHHEWDKRVGEKTAICPFCAVGCGVITSVEGGRVANVEGDPDHPINQGRLCSKGSALLQEHDNPARQRHVLYRAPNATEWTRMTWDEAMPRIAANIKRTRDATFVATDGGVVVNRTEGIAHMGSSAIKNEETYLLAKLMRGLGIVYLEHQARL